MFDFEVLTSGYSQARRSWRWPERLERTSLMLTTSVLPQPEKRGTQKKVSIIHFLTELFKSYLHMSVTFSNQIIIFKSVPKDVCPMLYIVYISKSKSTLMSIFQFVCTDRETEITFPTIPNRKIQ